MPQDLVGIWQMIRSPRSDLGQAPGLVGKQPDRRGRVELMAAGALVIADAPPDADAADAQRTRYPLDGPCVDDPTTGAVIGARSPDGATGDAHRRRLGELPIRDGERVVEQVPGPGSQCHERITP